MIRQAIKVVRQPIGDFYLVSLPASLLCEMCFSRPYERYGNDKSGRVDNSTWYQRMFVKKRANPIAEFLKTQDAALPGTFVIAANYNEKGEFLSDDDDVFESKICWRARERVGMLEIGDKKETVSFHELNIPENPKSAMVVDGQHRLGGFKGQSDEVLAMEVPCAIFLDLPIPMQAYVFATINFNQKPVNKSLNYELFAFDIDNEKPITWSPDKLAVFLSRRLNADNESPLRDRIKIGAVDCTEDAKSQEKGWKVSTATIVNGILSLITKDPQGDRNRLGQARIVNRNRALLVGYNRDDEKMPLRSLYVGSQDELIYVILRNYFVAVDVLFNKGKECFPVFHKTTGFTALFKVLKEMLTEVFKKDAVDVSSDMWVKSFCSQNKMVVFSDSFFNGSSASVAGHIANMLLMMSGFRKLEDFADNKCYEEYSRLWSEAKVY